MKAIIGLLGMIAFTISGSVAKVDVGAQKLAKMRALEAQSPNGIIIFSSELYRELVIENPRPYDVVMLFSVQSGCDDCTSVYNEMTGVQYSYKQTAFDTFFGVMYYATDPGIAQIFAEHRFETVPYIGTSKQENKREVDVSSFYRTDDLWLVKRDEIHEAQVVLDFVNKRLKHDVAFKMPFVTLLIKNLTIFGVLALLIAFVVQARKLLITPSFWWAIACLGYIVCTSGFVYCTLHGMPIFRFEQDQFGKMYVSEYFMRGQRSQYAGEGYITSTLAFCISFMFLGMVKSNVFIKKASERRFVLIIFLILGYMLLQFYLLCYKIKTPWYTTNFWPPNDYIKGPIMRDQGNNI